MSTFRNSKPTAPSTIPDNLSMKNIEYEGVWIKVTALLLTYLCVAHGQFFINMDKVLPRLGKKMDNVQFDIQRKAKLARLTPIKAWNSNYDFQRLKAKKSRPSDDFNDPEISIYGKASGLDSDIYNQAPTIYSPSSRRVLAIGPMDEQILRNTETGLTLKDFIQASPLYYMPLEKRIRLFDMLDLNGDGLLDMNEMMALSQLGKL